MYAAAFGQSAAQITARQAASGPLRPPDVQGGDVAVALAGRFLALRVGGDAADGEVDFDAAFGIEQTTFPQEDVCRR